MKPYVLIQHILMVNISYVLIMIIQLLNIIESAHTSTSTKLPIFVLSLYFSFSVHICVFSRKYNNLKIKLTYYFRRLEKSSKYLNLPKFDFCSYSIIKHVKD